MQLLYLLVLAFLFMAPAIVYWFLCCFSIKYLAMFYCLNVPINLMATDQTCKFPSAAPYLYLFASIPLKSKNA